MEIIDCFVLFFCLFVCLFACIYFEWMHQSGACETPEKKNGWQPIVRKFHFNSLYKNVTHNIPEQRKKSLLELEILNT